jgi:hypothetical protein
MLTRYMRQGRDAIAKADDGQKALLAVGLVGLAGFLYYQFIYKPSKQQQPGQPGQTPTGPVQPGPGPGNLPAPPGGTPTDPTSGATATQGDTITVSSSALGSLLGGSVSLPSRDVEMVVTGAAPGSPVVMARTTGRAADGVPAGIDAPVPRAAILSVTHGGVAPPPVAPPIPGGLPPLPGGLPGGLPPIPGLPIPPGVLPPQIAVVDLGNPMPLQQGHHYRARIQLDPLSGMFANQSAVANQFASQGFTDIQIFGPDDQLPADWPLMTVVAKDKNTYYGQGTWGGATGAVPRPPQIAMAWEQ